MQGLSRSLPALRKRNPAATSLLRRAGGLGVAVLIGGCTTIVVPPAAVQQPQPVFILDHGRHTSLVLPHPDGLVRYAYGDWDWYVEVETGPWEATSAVLWPTRAGLGRRLLAGAATARGVREAVDVDIEALHTVQVEAGDIAVLRASLDRLHRSNRAGARFNAAYNLVFVPHPEPYTFWHNSNHQVAQWLQRLGCTVRGGAFWASWAVRPPEDGRNAAAIPYEVR